MKNNYRNCINLLTAFYLINFVNGLYEDQIGKFDWRKCHIGKVKEAIIDPNENDNLFVVTEENILASLCPRTSKLKWREIFEKSPRGLIKLFHVVTGDETNVLTSMKNSNYGFDILTVSGVAPAIIRGWSSSTGNLQWEWSLMPIQVDKAKDAYWYYENYNLYHIIPVWNSHLEITKYFVTTGHSQGHTTSKISTPWIEKSNCILSNSYFVCANKNQLISFDITEDETKIYRKTLPFEVNSIPKPLKGQKGFVILNKKIISLNPDEKSCTQLEGSTILYTKFQDQGLYIVGDVQNNIFHVNGYKADSCEKINDMQFDINYPEYYGKPEILEFKCQQKRDNNICNMYATTEDGALLFIQQNKIKFVREESLSNIVSAELIDLPLSDAEGAMESELNSKPGDIAGAFIRRITSQATQLKNAVLHLLGIGSQSTQNHKSILIRDAFGLHKMMVLLTKTGKLFGIDNLTGEQHWIRYIPNIKNFDDYENMRLIVQRTSKHFPFEPICTIVAKSKVTDNGILFQFNPINGQTVEGGLQELDYKIKQLAILRENEDDFIKGLLLLDHLNEIHVIPKSASKKSDGMFLYTANRETALLEGYHVHEKNNKLNVLPIWKTRLNGQSGNHKIVAIAAKNPNEHVHSQGRVLGDRSVLYKYINPNLVAVVTQALDNVHKYIMNVHLIDVVSGSVVFSMTHRKVRGPLNIIHSENWLVYSYYNDKVRRHEMTTVELYEGKVQANSTIWSSLDAPPLPLVERQSFIFPAIIETMKETITERGITNKHILIGLSSGGILEMPWAFLDPRRPVSNQQREEGAIPYIPELPLPTENIINYNQSITKIQNIYTAPSGLESTCLVVAYGLDLYVTRVSPSKTFDLLKEDFDYFLISVVLLGLTVGSFVTKHLSSRKALKQAWK